MVNNYSFVNIIDNEFYKVLEGIQIEWYEHSLHKSGRDFIIEKDCIYFYTNSNVKKLHTIEDISRTIKKIESTPYRSAKLKENQIVVEYNRTKRQLKSNFFSGNQSNCNSMLNSIEKEIDNQNLIKEIEMLKSKLLVKS